MSKKIISFSLWGANKKYTIGAIKNVELANGSKVEYDYLVIATGTRNKMEAVEGLP